MQYPELASELIALLHEDQTQYKAFAVAYHDKSFDKATFHRMAAALRRDSLRRAQSMLRILQIIQLPTKQTIGSSAIEAVAVLALHSTYAIMEEVLEVLKKCASDGHNGVVRQAIPALMDRVLILEGHKQMFATQWLHGEDGKPFLYPVNDFQHVNQRRHEYGLKAVRLPRVVAFSDSMQSKPRLATEQDMRAPTSAELHEYTDDYLEK